MDEPLTKFKLKEEFLAEYKEKTPDWGPIGEFVFYRTYSRKKKDGTLEAWWETVQRIVETTYDVQIEWFAKNRLLKHNWHWFKAQKSAQTMYDLIFNFKFTPPGRGVWAMVLALLQAKNSAVLNSCSFISTAKIAVDFTRPFTFAADMSMLGVGVGFDLLGADKITIKEEPKTTEEPFIIKDTREGWTELIETVLLSLIRRADFPLLRDYSKVRGKGEPIKTFGGISNGPTPLEILIQDIISIFGYSMPTKMKFKTKDDIEYSKSTSLTTKQSFPQLLSGTQICDTFNAIGKCVVSGNVRRSAQAAIGLANDWEHITRKNIFKAHIANNLEEVKQISLMYPIPQYAKNLLKTELTSTMFNYKQFGPYSWRWISNNPIIVETGENYNEYVDQITETGEPGLFWLTNAQKFGRMIDPANWKDRKAIGSNPCLEFTLETGELCNTVEVFINRCTTLDEFLKCLKWSYLYAKVVSLIPTHDEQTNAILLKNRRIGVSLAGVTSAIKNKGFRTTIRWLDKGYKYLQDLDAQYSDWLVIPRSRKLTTIKPGGTIPLLAGEASGVSFPHSEYYIRRVRVANNSPYIQIYKKAGYKVEQDVYDRTCSNIEFPVHHRNFYKAEKNVTIWEQLEIVSMVQKHWSDNQVSATIKFYPHEIDDIKTALPIFEEKLKCISFLPQDEHSYEQAPFEAITEETYKKRIKNLKPVNLQKAVHEVTDQFCDGETCQLPLKEQ